MKRMSLTPGNKGETTKEEPKNKNKKGQTMQIRIIATLAAILLATPALAATGLAPDPASWITLSAGFAMVGLTAGGRHRRSGRVAD
ncbi:MAG: hypothetical protein ACRC1J_00695 [Sandaracinobacteroides sp.]